VRCDQVPSHPVDGEYVKEWLVLGPFFPDDLERDFLAGTGGEANINPREGDTVATEDGKILTWKRYKSKADMVDLVNVFGYLENTTVYAFCMLQSETTGDVSFSVRNDDGIAVWINGKRVYSYHDLRDLFLDSDLFEANLESGANCCLVKVTQENWLWGFAMKPLPASRAIISGVVTDEAGSSVPNVDVRAEQYGQPIATAKTDTSGRYKMGVYPVSGKYDFSATQGRMGNWHLDVQLSEQESRTLNIKLRDAVSIEGRLLMLDDKTAHAAVPVQAIRNGEVVATVLSDRWESSGRYEFINLKPGDYQLRCQILGGYVYYGEERRGKRESQKAGRLEDGTAPDKSISLRVEQGEALKNIDFRFASFKKGTWRNYTCLDGLSCIEISAICRDTDGVMWFGTNGGGVSRYDGRGFVNFTTRDGLASNRVHAIYCDPDGLMWFGTEGGVSRYDGSDFVNFTTEDGLVDNRVMDIRRDTDGIMWFATMGGVSRYDGEEFLSLTTEDGLVQSNVQAIYCDTDGDIWFGTHGGVSTYDGDRFVNLTVADGLIDQRVNSICCDPEGMMWFATASGVSRYDGQEFVSFTSEKDGLVSHSARSVCCDPDGTLWFGILGGVSRYDGKTFVNFTSQDGLPDSGITGGIYCDTDGMMWFGTYMGVSRYDRETFADLSKKDGLPADLVRSIHRAPDGTMWIGTSGGISHYDGKQFINFTMEDRPVGSFVNVVLCDPDGVLWIGTEWGGVSRYDGRQFVDFTIEDGSLPHPRVNAIYRDMDGVLWFGTGLMYIGMYIGGNGGLVRYDGKEFATFTAEDGLPSDEVLAICRETDGALWIGTAGGLSRYDARGMGDFPHFVNFTTEDGLPDDSISAIYSDPNGVMWFGTSDGVSRYDARDAGNSPSFTSFTTQDGLVHGIIIAIHRTTDGVLWFASYGGGISMYDGIAWSSLDTRDGLAGDHVRAMDEEPDGSLWFATSAGLVRYRRNSTRPRVRIISVTAEQTYTDLSAIPGFIAGQRITIEYAALDFKTIPEKQQYRCRVYETGDVRLETRDTGQGKDVSSLKSQVSSLKSDVSYDPPTKETTFDWIPEKPGTFIFEVQAIDRDLNYSEPARLSLTVQPDPVLAELNYLRRVSGKYHFDSIVGRSAAMRQVRVLMERVIDSGLTVLIIGETGTGKELVAKAIHHNSQRREHPLRALNCGAVPKDLVASTLFGHRRGAFTGANADRMGLFEEASGGTVLLDEIGEMPQDAQIHLLRVLEEREVQRLGENVPRSVDVWVIAMSNRDLVKEVGEGHFREDLYYRLSEFPIRIPPLREHVEDIPLLAEHFLQEIDRDLDGFAPGMFDMLQSHPWPGNVRELRNVIRRAAALAEEGEQIQPYHFPPEITHGESLIQEILSERTGLSAAVEALQRRLIEDALRQCNGNRSQAAKILNIHRPSLIRLMKRFGIE
jgi:DNA-binding NtrC family response regulator/ligand-binding sensor domain-containing protein